jgi:hypothetical protein
MTTLLGRFPKDSFKELLKVSDSEGLTPSLQNLTDGEGKATTLALSSTTVAINGLAFPTSGSGTGKILAVASNGTSMEWITPAASGVTSVNGQTGAVTLTSTNIAEGTNQYFTNARARSAISLTAGASGATYNSTTGVLDMSALTAGGGGSSSLTSTQIGFGSGTNTLTGSTSLTWSESSKILTVGGTADLKAYTEGTQSYNATTTLVINCSLGTIFPITMNNSITSLSFSNVPSAGKAFSLTLFITQAGGGFKTIAWPASVKWSDGVQPTLTTTDAKTDIVTLITFTGGTTWFGLPGGTNF